MDKMVPNVPLTYLEIPYGPTWTVTINAFRIGEKPSFSNGAQNAFYFPEAVANLDTFSPFIKLPKTLGPAMFSKFFHDVPDLNQDNGMLLGPCDLSKYQSINLFVNDRYYLKLLPESFIVDIGLKSKCFIPIKFSEDETFILGEPFFRNFYTVFDDSKGMVGIAPSVNFVRASVIEGMVPNDELPHPGEDAKKNNANNMQNIPKQNDPMSIVNTVIQTIKDFFSGKSSSTSPSNSSDSMKTVEIVVVVICVVFLLVCCAAGIIYMLISYYSNNAAASKAAGPQ
jgi:hypothetical protein